MADPSPAYTVIQTSYLIIGGLILLVVNMGIWIGFLSRLFNKVDILNKTVFEKNGVTPRLVSKKEAKEDKTRIYDQITHAGDSLRTEIGSLRGEFGSLRKELKECIDKGFDTVKDMVGLMVDKKN